MPPVMLKLLFIILISMQSLVAYGDTTRKALGEFLSSNPKLELLELKHGKSVATLKGSDEPYTGPVSMNSSIWQDVTINDFFVDGSQSPGARVFNSKSTGEKLSGEFKTYYPDGTKNSVINLVNGQQDGLSTFWRPNGKIKSTHNYYMGVEDGEYEVYYENGNKKQTGVVGPRKSIQWTDWNISGHKESFYYFKFKNEPPVSLKHWDSEGRKTGSWIERYDDGSMKKEKFYSYGHPERRWTTWHDNGNKNTEANFAFGLLNGSFKFWNKEGILVVSGDFKDSKEVGKWRFKDNDGNKIDRPKDLYFDITDDGKPITIVNKRNIMEEFYISIYMPLAIALLISLPLLGAGIAIFMIRRSTRKGKQHGRFSEVS